MMQNGYVFSMKKLHLIVTLLAVLLTLMVSVAYPFVWKSQVDVKLATVQDEVSKLKSSNQSNRELLIEIKFNLKHFMQRQGIEYIENTNKQKE